MLSYSFAIELSQNQVPLTIGHEFSGIVEEIGSGVSDKYKVGQKVVVQPIIYCGECGSCKEGIPNCCDKNGFVGLSGWGGGLVGGLSMLKSPANYVSRPNT